MGAVDVFCLGAYGGMDMSNLSCYLVCIGGHHYLLDAGSPLRGIERVRELHGDVLRLDRVDAIFVSHAHLDHLAGLVVGSPALLFKGTRPLIATPPVLCALERFVFNHTVWPNVFAARVPTDAPFALTPLAVGKVWEDAAVAVTAWPLTHGDYGHDAASTCFVLEPKDPTTPLVVYFGDVSLTRNPYCDDADDESVRRIHAIVDHCAGRAAVLFLECAYATPVAVGRGCGGALFGHLDVRRFLSVARLFKGALRVFATHRKPSFDHEQARYDASPVEAIETAMRAQLLDSDPPITFLTQGAKLRVASPSRPRPLATLPALQNRACRNALESTPR